MTASIFVMMFPSPVFDSSPLPVVDPRAKTSGRRFPIVSLFSMLREVEALHFFLLGNSQTNGGIDQFQDDEGSHDGEPPGDRYTDKLIEQLAGISFEQAGGHRIALRVLEDRIDGAGGEDPGQ